jgi:hypothetical protein
MKEVQLVVSADVFLLKRFVNIDVKFQDVVSAYVFLPNRLVKLQDVVLPMFSAQQVCQQGLSDRFIKVQSLALEFENPEGKSIGDKRHRKQNRGGIRTSDLLLRGETRYPLRHTDTDQMFRKRCNLLFLPMFFCHTGLSTSMSSFKMWFLHMSFCQTGWSISM